jgi:hypothetical protein
VYHTLGGMNVDIKQLLWVSKSGGENASEC